MKKQKKNIFYSFMVVLNVLLHNVWCNKNRTKLISVILLWLVRFSMHQTLATAHMNSTEISLIWFNDNLFIKNEYSKNMVRNWNQSWSRGFIEIAPCPAPFCNGQICLCTACSWQQFQSAVHYIKGANSWTASNQIVILPNFSPIVWPKSYFWAPKTNDVSFVNLNIIIICRHVIW